MAGYQMTAQDRDKLRSNRLYLLKNITPSEDLLGYLLQEKILTDDMKEEIEVEKLKKTKISKLLDILPRRGSKAFHHFIYGLMESSQPEPAKCLDESLARTWEMQNPAQHRAHNAPQHPPSVRVRPSPRPIVPAYNMSTDETGILNPIVNPIDLDDTHVIKVINDVKNNYKMTSKPRGRAIIINNTYFVSQTPREGAEFDSLNLCTHLEQLCFTTELHSDLTANEMKTIMMDESRRKDQLDADCFLVFLLSHGSQGYIYGIDGQKVSIQDDIVTPFDGDHCPALLNKPKMFFIQACQGESATEGVIEESGGDSQVDATPVQEPELEQVFRNLRIQDKAENLPRLGAAHEKSDIVLAYSTVPGYRSWRRTDLGSWFVRAVIKVFAAEAHTEDLLSLLVKVRQLISENHTNHEDHSFVQLTRTDETTRKKIYFFPGYYETNRGSRV